MPPARRWSPRRSGSGVSSRRRAGPAQAGRPGPHWLAQDQQRAGPGAADQAHGQDPGDRRDRGGPARRGHRDRVRPAWPGVRRLHGRGGHPAPGAERVPDAHARRHRHPGDRGHQDAEGRHERGVPRLGQLSGEHALLHRLGGRPAPVPDDGPGLPAGHRRRGPRAGAGPDRAAARRDRRLRRRRQQRDRRLPRVHPGRGRAADRLRGRRRRRRAPGADRGDTVPWHPGRAARDAHLRAAGR